MNDVLNLNQAIEENLTNVSFNLKGARELLQKGVDISGLSPMEIATLWELGDKFVNSYFKEKLAEKYNVLSDLLFQRIRIVEGKQEKYEVPLVFSVGLSNRGNPSYSGIILSDDAPFVECEGGVAKVKLDSENGYNHGVVISATVPPMNLSAKRAYLEAVDFLQELSALPYVERDNLVKNIISRRNAWGKEKFVDPRESSFYEAWIPEELSVEETAPIPVDPVLLLRYDETNFLIHRLDVPGERSLETLLAEFTES